MNEIIRYYSAFDEWGRLDREPLEYLVNWHYIQKYLPQTGNILDNGAGPGKYAMALARQGYQVTLTDLTPRVVEQAEGKAREFELHDQFDGFHVRDARHLEDIPSEYYDAVLMLGPLYHLQTDADRIAAMKELYRVTKPGGVVFIALMTRIRKLQTALLYPDMWKPLDHMDSIKSFMETGIFNHQDEGRFTGAYFYPLEEIKPFMESSGFETIELIGSSSIGGRFTEENWNDWRSRGEEEFNQMMELLYQYAADPSILGISSHLLYIGRKR